MRIAIILCIFLAALPAWAGTFRDDFEDGNTDGWRKLKGTGGGFSLDQSAQWFVENGQLIHISQNVCGWASAFGIGDNAWKDYVFQFQFRIEKRFPNCGPWPPVIGFGVHYDTPGGVINGVDVVIVANENAFDDPRGERFFGGGNSLINLAAFPVEIGKWYTAEAVVEDNRYQMFIDGNLLWDVKYDFPDAGAAVLFGKNCEVHFDNVVIIGDEVPDVGPSGLAIEPLGTLATSWARLKVLAVAPL